MPGSAMLQISVLNLCLTRSLFQSHLTQIRDVGPHSVPPRWNGSANDTVYPVRHGYTTPPTIWQNPGLTLPALISQRYVHGSFRKRRNHLRGATFFAEIACLPISTSWLNKCAAARPEERSIHDAS